MPYAGSGRVIAMDIGDARIGIAVSDSTRMIAQPLETYRRVGYGPDVKYALSLCERHETDQVVLGLPLNMDGSQGPQAEKVRAFGALLLDAGLRVEYQDERMTTMTAKRALLEGNMRRGERRQAVDKIAAAIILEQWLAGHKG